MEKKSKLVTDDKGPERRGALPEPIPGIVSDSAKTLALANELANNSGGTLGFISVTTYNGDTGEICRRLVLGGDGSVVETSLIAAHHALASCHLVMDIGAEVLSNEPMFKHLCEADKVALWTRIVNKTIGYLRDRVANKEKIVPEKTAEKPE